MPYHIDYTENAIEDIAYFKKYERVLIADAIDQHLRYQPLVQVRNRKPLEANELGHWELRVGKYRIFYDVETEDRRVVIKTVGWKEHNMLYIRGMEYNL